MKLKQLRTIGTSELSRAWLRDMERSIDDTLEGRLGTYDALSQISNTMKKLMPGFTFEIKLVVCDKPFMMCIYPDIKELERKCAPIVNILNDNSKGAIDLLDKWSDITKWVIEVDSKLFKASGSSYYVESGREFVAILMHEIGHVAHTNHQSLILNYRKNKMKFKMVEKVMLSESYLIKKVFMPMLIHTLNFRVITKGHLRQDLEEIKADLNVPADYKTDLVAYLNRCILSNPEACSVLVTTKEEFNDDQKVAVLFTRETLLLIKNRRNILNTYIAAQHKTTKSPYIREFMKRFNSIFGGVNFNSKEYEAEVEPTVNIIQEGARAREIALEVSRCEDVAMKILTESQRVSDRDLSILQVEADSIETNEDKIYVLHTIYDYIELVSFEHRKKNKQVTAEEIDKDSRIIYLKSLRDEIAKRKIVEKQYGVFIKYPTGYEG